MLVLVARDAVMNPFASLVTVHRDAQQRLICNENAISGWWPSVSGIFKTGVQNLVDQALRPVPFPLTCGVETECFFPHLKFPRNHNRREVQ